MRIAISFKVEQITEMEIFVLFCLLFQHIMSFVDIRLYVL